MKRAKPVTKKEIAQMDAIASATFSEVMRFFMLDRVGLVVSV